VADDGEEAIRNRAVRKSLEMMTTLREEGEETEGGGEGGEVRSAQEQGVLAQALRELALVAKLKNEAVGREEHIEVLHNRLYDASARERWGHRAHNPIGCATFEVKLRGNVVHIKGAS
jgi:hypothetical protein